MADLTDDVLHRWIAEAEGRWPNEAIARECLRLRAEVAALRSDLAIPLVESTLAYARSQQVDLDRRLAEQDVGIRCRVREALERLVKASAENRWTGLPVDEMADANEAAAIDNAKLVLEEAPREQPEQALPEAVTRWRATTDSQATSIILASGLQSPANYNLEQCLSYLRTARLGGQPSERERRAVELLESVVQLGREGAFGLNYVRREDHVNYSPSVRPCTAGCDCVICEAERLLGAQASTEPLRYLPANPSNCGHCGGTRYLTPNRICHHCSPYGRTEPPP
jgi:hypothetical protein